MDFADVHAWTVRGPRVDILQTSFHGPPKNQTNHFLRKKMLGTGGIWTPVYCMEAQCLTN